MRNQSMPACCYWTKAMGSNFTGIKCSWFSLSNLSMPAVRCVVGHARRSIAWLLITLSSHLPGSYKHQLISSAKHWLAIHIIHDLYVTVLDHNLCNACILLLLWIVCFCFLVPFCLRRWGYPLRQDRWLGKREKCQASDKSARNSTKLYERRTIPLPLMFMPSYVLLLRRSLTLASFCRVFETDAVHWSKYRFSY